MVKKKARRGGRIAGVNKRANVIEALRKTPDASPNELSRQFESQGLDISTQYISNIKGQLKRAGGVPAASAVGRLSTPLSVFRISSIDVDSLVAARQLVDEVGMEKARRALSVLAQLMETR